jgi:hypothetical protein
MFHQPNLNDQRASKLAISAIPQLETSAATSKPRAWAARAEISVDELAYRTLIAFREHSHINNILTHISGANWRRVEQELRAIFEPATEPAGLSALSRNMLDLICAERGVTGRILKPLFESFLRGLLERELAERTIWRVSALYRGVDRKAREAIEAATN